MGGTSGLWVDVPGQGQEGQVEQLREHYLRLGVPSQYLTDQMIGKLMQTRRQSED